MELENISSEHKEIIAQLQLNHAEKVNTLREQLQEAESCKSKAEKEVPLIIIIAVIIIILSVLYLIYFLT